jgi:hypothetical protein
MTVTPIPSTAPIFISPLFRNARDFRIFQTRLYSLRNSHTMKSGRKFQMKLSFVVPVALAALFVAYAQQAMPRMSTVEPGNGKSGDVITVAGENLQKDSVAKVYLTDGKNDAEVQIMEQTPTAIKFKIPAKVPAGGRLALMVLTAGKDPKLMEQPVKVQIDE